MSRCTPAHQRDRGAAGSCGRSWRERRARRALVSGAGPLAASTVHRPRATSGSDSRPTSARPRPTGRRRRPSPTRPVPRRGRAANRRRHTPVWFMRQAGRSLPEYRAVRGDGSILDAIKHPELAAEITLQPVRRYGVDAAVLYSDIVVPGPRRRLRHRRRPGHRPGGRRARSAARPTSPASAARARRRAYVAETVELARRRARRRAAAGVRRRAVHRRQLPDRGAPEPHLRAHQGADAHRRSDVARR